MLVVRSTTTLVDAQPMVIITILVLKLLLNAHISCWGALTT
jgi:hypothetical protein